MVTSTTRRVSRVLATALFCLAALTSVGRTPAAAGALLFEDGFEGGMSSWTTVRGVAVQSQDAVSGAKAAEAISSGSPAFARKRLGTSVTALDFEARVKVVSQGGKPVTMLAVSARTGGPLASVFVNAKGRLAVNVGGVSTVSTIAVGRGDWHKVRLRVEVAGSNSRTEVWWGDQAEASLISTRSLGTSPVARVQIGDAAVNKSYTLRFDDVRVVEVEAAPDLEPPTAPPSLEAEASTRWVHLSWGAAADNVGVTGYQVVRDGGVIATVGSANSYADIAVQPGTDYTYQVRAVDAAGNLGPPSTAVPVTTLPDSGAPVVAAAGDIACPASGAVTATTCRQHATSDLLVAGGFDRVLALGDNQYEQGALTDYLASYDDSWGRVRRITSPVPGNHEYLTDGAAGYFDYFGDAAGDRSKGYYSFDVGTWHVIALNSNCAALGPADGCAEGMPQNDWLEDDLTDHAGACTLAYFHHPLVSSGKYAGVDAVQPFWEDLHAAGADIILAGHSHHYERFMPMNPDRTADPSGIRQFVVGTGGKNHATGTAASAATSQVRNTTTFGVLELTLGTDSYDWRFLPEAGATFTDVGTDSCID